MFSFFPPALRYGDDWAVLAGCTRITQTYCNLNDVIPDYRSGYKVRVQLATMDDVSEWKVIKKFLLNAGKNNLSLMSKCDAVG